MAVRKDKKCICGHGMVMIPIGIMFLIIAAMLYMGYGWMEIFGVLGILAIIKGIYLRTKCVC